MNDEQIDKILSVLQSQSFARWYNEGDFAKDLMGEVPPLSREWPALHNRVREYIQRRFIDGRHA